MLGRELPCNLLEILELQALPLPAPLHESLMARVEGGCAYPDLLYRLGLSHLGRQELALDAIADAGVDLLLAGHNHQASTHSARDLATRAGPALVIQAGTATSIRLRDETQSFNRIDIEGGRVTLTVQSWDGQRLVAGDEQSFAREGDHWRLAHRPAVTEPAD
jgi:hypothetical protein